MREHSATALAFTVVLNSHSQSFLGQDLAIGIKPKPGRSDFHFAYPNSRHAENGFTGSAESVSSIDESTGNNRYYNEKQSFVYPTPGIGALGREQCKKSKQGRIPEVFNL